MYFLLKKIEEKKRGEIRKMKGETQYKYKGAILCMSHSKTIKHCLEPVASLKLAM